jgi:hypothetical protein
MLLVMEAISPFGFFTTTVFPDAGHPEKAGMNYDC